MTTLTIEKEVKTGDSTPMKIQNASVSPYEIERLMKSGLSGKDICFVLAVKATYGDIRNASIEKNHFCAKWDIKEEDFDLAIARINKKKIISVPTETVVQLELFPMEDEE